MGLLLGCQAQTEDTDTEAAGAVPASCDPQERVGTWLNHNERLTGDCGLLHDIRSTTLDPDAAPENCEKTKPDAWAANGCTLTRTMTCTLTGFRAEYVTTLTQADATGDLFTGQAEITTFDNYGLVCSSTYSWSKTRVP